jgi:hypothetical protein
MKLTKARLAERLRGLGELQFTCGQPASWSDGLVEVSVDRVGDEAAGGNHLVTVFAGFPPPAQVQGLEWELRRVDAGGPVRKCQTDRRGQVWLRGLEPGVYCFLFQGPGKVGLPPAADSGTGSIVVPWEPFRIDLKFHAHFDRSRSPAAEPALALAARGAAPIQVFRSPDDKLQATLRETPTGQLALGVEAALEGLGDCLLGFEILDADKRLLVGGFVGLAPIGGRKGYGEVGVSQLRAEAKETLPGETAAPGPGKRELYLRLRPVAFQDLTAADREALERSLEATELAGARAVLEEALRRLREERP